jgi:putative NADH-flavin reductase
MKITVIGASAGLGLETVKRALQRNHEVTTLSRSEVPMSNTSNLACIYGNALDKKDVISALSDADAVIVTLGTRKDMNQTTLFSDFANLLIDVQKSSGSKATFLIVTGFGTGDSGNYVGWFVKLFLKYFLKDVYANKALMEESISNSDMNWIIVRPGRLLDKPVTEKYRVETSLYKGINIGGINRSDVADYLVKQAERPYDLKKFVGLSEK